MQPHRVGHELALTRVFGLDGDLLAVHQLPAQAFQFDASTLKFRGRAGAAESGFGGHLSGPAAQHPVTEESVHGSAGLSDGVSHPWQVKEGSKVIGHRG